MISKKTLTKPYDKRLYDVFKYIFPLDKIPPVGIYVAIKKDVQ